MKTALLLLTTCLSLFCTTAANAQYIVNIAGKNSFDSGGTGDGGYAWQAGLYRPISICRDSIGNLYLGDRAGVSGLDNTLVRKIDVTTGIITTVVGNRYAPESSDSSDNVPATSVRLRGAHGLCFDKIGYLLIADANNRIRKLNLTTGRITTIAGRHDTLGYHGDGGPATAATLGLPIDVCVDRYNNVLFIDIYNNVIRKVDAVTGIITTVAGRNDSSGYNGDGIPATSAMLNQPNGICLDTAGNILIGDSFNNRVRMVNVTTGIISTIAGTGVDGYSGNGGPATAAEVSRPTRLAFDKHGNLFMAGGYRIRKIAAGTGIITTYAGTGLMHTLIDTAGNNGPATMANIGAYALCFDTCDNLFMGGVGTHIRAIIPSIPIENNFCGLKYNEVKAMPSITDGLRIYPNPGDGTYFLRFEATTTTTLKLSITDCVGRQVLNIESQTNTDIPFVINGASGIFIAHITTGDGQWSRKIVKR